MKKLFKIEDKFFVEKHGLIITGALIEFSDSQKKEIGNLTGSQILIKSPTGQESFFEVKGVDILHPCFSPDLQKAICISLGMEISLNMIEIGSFVYCCDN